MDPMQMQNWMAQAHAALRAEFDQKLNNAAAAMRGMTERRAEALDRRLNELAQIAQAMSQSRSGGFTPASGLGAEGERVLKQGGPDDICRACKAGIIRVEDIPGRRVPFFLTVDMLIGNGTTSRRSQSTTISQDGPFVAVANVATFVSSYQYQVTTKEDPTPLLFTGRSYGRYRPIHSAWDLNDRGPFQTHAWDVAFYGGGPTPFIGGGDAAFTSSASGFRTMEIDGRFEVINAGSSFPRQNQSIPSSLFIKGINNPQTLGCLDFFERGEVIQWYFEPTHVNNPPAGNANGDAIWPLANSWPFLAGQYDPHEGIIQAGALTTSGEGPTIATTDYITRLPDGILTVGYLGYRIQQPVGPAR